MSNVILNQTDQDIISVDFFQHGQNHTETTLKEELLDGEKSYHFACTHLSVPLKNVPIHPVAGDTALFLVRRRVGDTLVAEGLPAFLEAYEALLALPGTPVFAEIRDVMTDLINVGAMSYEQLDDFEDAAAGGDGDSDDSFDFDDYDTNTAQLRTWALEAAELFRTGGLPLMQPAISTFSISPSRPQYSVSEFVQALQQYCENLNRSLTTGGLDNEFFGLPIGAAVDPVAIATEADVKRYLDIIASCDSSLLFTPGENFFQYFVLEFTAYGASILGIKLDDLHKQGDVYFLAPTGDSYSTAPFDANGAWVDSANTDDSNPIFTAHHPVYSTADQRVKVSISSHLPLLSNVLINNEKQSSERDIAEAYFENQVKSEVRYSDGVFSTRLISKVYSGQASMIRKHDSHHQWNKLLSSYRLRYMRFFLFVTYRDYQVATNTFVLRKMPVTVNAHDYWNFTIKFVSDT